MALPRGMREIGTHRWLLPKSGDMKTDAVVLADHKLLDALFTDGTLQQLANVAGLPGIVGNAWAMPDAHQGYGFPIGGVAAFDPESGVVSPGGVGYDINCGVRLVGSLLAADDLSPRDYHRLADALAVGVPAGVGQTGGVNLGEREMDRVLTEGAAWAVRQGLGLPGDLAHMEAQGALPGARPDEVSSRARERGRQQAGTLGAGNHFLELARVEEVFDPAAAPVYGLHPGGLVIWIHSGSRGLGHQVCDDFLRLLARDASVLHPPDRQLVAASPGSKLGRAYLGAMAAAANYAFNNRQVLCHLVREIMAQTLGRSPAKLGLELIYDLAHNVAKLEKHKVDGKLRSLWVHRKGATRALGPGHPELPTEYRPVGQPVLLPGDMGRASYVLRGTAVADRETFASAAHGAGRVLSRTAAKKLARGRKIEDELAARKITVRSHSRGTLAEEMPEAYKDVTQVARVLHESGVATLVARTRPIVVIKG
ncbi:MAG: RtcB family protein [Deltaproteobacteria bacterium]|nr:RtcB family protein [Deltaproteobacteria bacterium]